MNDKSKTRFFVMAFSLSIGALFFSPHIGGGDGSHVPRAEKAAKRPAQPRVVIILCHHTSPVEGPSLFFRGE